MYSNRLKRAQLICITAHWQRRMCHTPMSMTVGSNGQVPLLSRCVNKKQEKKIKMKFQDLIFETNYL